MAQGSAWLLLLCVLVPLRTSAEAQNSIESRRVEILRGVWWRPLANMQIRRRQVENIVIGREIRVKSVLPSRITFAVEGGNDSSEYSTELDNVEPIGSCLADARKQFDFLAMHSGVIAFMNPQRDLHGSELPRAAETDETQHFSHTYNSLLNAARRYDKNTAVLLYYYGVKAICVLAFSHEGIIGYAISQTPRSTLEPLINHYLESAASGADLSEVSRQVSHAIFPAELEQKLRGYNKLVVVPYGIISLIPFGGIDLQVSKAPLITKFAYTMAPSLTQVGIAPGLHGPDRVRSAKPSAIVVGNPLFDDKKYIFFKLTRAQQEAEAVATRLGGKALVREQATLENISRDITKIRERGATMDIFYLATHGFADRRPSTSSESFLALANGERLNYRTIREIGYAGSRLVVMSACQTGAGWVDEAGAVGLSRLFHLSNAHEVVMSLWNVDDMSTSYFMQIFMNEYLKNWPKSSAAAALALAATGTRLRFPALRDWAAFSVFGVGPF